MTAGTLRLVVNAQIFYQVDWDLTLGWYVSVLMLMGHVQISHQQMHFYLIKKTH